MLNLCDLMTVYKTIIKSHKSITGEGGGGGQKRGMQSQKHFVRKVKEVKFHKMYLFE